MSVDDFEDPHADWPLLPEQYEDANAAIDFLYNSILESGQAGIGPGMEAAIVTLAESGPYNLEDTMGHLAMGMTLVAHHLLRMRQKGMGKSPQQTVEALRRAFTPPPTEE